MKTKDWRVSPVLVLSLTALWLMLNQTLAPGQILLGVGLSVFLAWSASALRPVRATLRRIDAGVILSLVVLGDILRSNVAVGRLVLGLAGRRQAHSEFLKIPLELRDPHGLAVLAMIITATPGTVWAGLSPETNTLTLHVLDLQDADAWIRLIKQRYEKPLMRIFE